MVEAPVYFLVLVPALLDVPSRQPILDLAVGAGVLLDHDYLRAARRQDIGDFSACGSAANHRDNVSRRLSGYRFHHGA